MADLHDYARTLVTAFAASDNHVILRMMQARIVAMGMAHPHISMQTSADPRKPTHITTYALNLLNHMNLYVNRVLKWKNSGEKNRKTILGNFKWNSRY